MLGLQNEREWAAFCATVLEQPELAQDKRFSSNTLRVENKEALRVLIVTAFAALTREQVIARLEAAAIANASVNTMQDVWRHPQLASRQRWREVDSPAGALPALLPPASNSAFQPRMDKIPGLGEHSAAILRGLGYAEEQIQTFKQRGII